MATFDDIARMRAALMAEKRQRMAQHPQQVAGAVGQAQGALAALAEQLQRQGIARDRITAANARAEADRKQRAAVEAAKAKAAAERAAAAEAGRNQRAAATLEQKNIASDLSPENRPGLIGGGALEGDLDELSGIGLTPDEAEAFARSQLGYDGGDFREMDDMNRERNEAADDRLRGQEMDAARLAKLRADTDRSRASAAKARRPADPQVAADKQLSRDLKRAQLKKLQEEVEFGKPPTPTEARKVTTLQSIKQTLQDLQKMKPGVDTGPLAKLEASARDFFGVEQRPGVAEFRSRLMLQLTQKISQLAGANVTPQELQRILESMPHMGDNDANFERKTRSAIADMDELIRGERRAISAAGKDTRGLDAGQPVKRVWAVSPDGRRGKLRADQAAAAQAKGWKIEGPAE